MDLYSNCEYMKVVDDIGEDQNIDGKCIVDEEIEMILKDPRGSDGNDELDPDCNDDSKCYRREDMRSLSAILDEECEIEESCGRGNSGDNDDDYLNHCNDESMMTDSSRHGHDENRKDFLLGTSSTLSDITHDNILDDMTHERDEEEGKIGEGKREEEVEKDLIVVFIKGFITDKGVQSYPEECVPPNAKVINVYPSSVGSIHDRVCEVFYELVGGRVDYGEEHSRFHGHDRYGRHFHCADSDSDRDSTSSNGSKGLLSQWDEDHPIIVIGHSFGGLTAYALQTYLEERRFVTHPHTSHRWIKGIITVCSPLNGSLRVYVAGLHLACPWIVYWGTIGHLLMIMVHVIEYCRYPWLLKYLHDFDQGFWKYHHQYKHSLLTLLLSFAGYALHCQNDSIVYDAGIDAVRYWTSHQVSRVYPDTFYYSISGIATLQEEDHSLFHDSFPLRSRFIQEFRQRLYQLRRKWRLTQQLAPRNLYGVDTQPWLSSPSDGMISLFSQQFPRFYSEPVRGQEEVAEEEVERTNREERNTREEVDQIAAETEQERIPREEEEKKSDRPEQERDRGAPVLEVHELQTFEEHALLRPGIWNYVTLSLTHYCLTAECSRLWLLIWYTCHVMHDYTRPPTSSSSSSPSAVHATSTTTTTASTAAVGHQSVKEQEVRYKGREGEGDSKTATSSSPPPSFVFDRLKPHCRPINLTLSQCHSIGSEYYGAWSECAYLLFYLFVLVIVIFVAIGFHQLFTLSPSFPSSSSSLPSLIPIDTEDVVDRVEEGKNSHSHGHSWLYQLVHSMLRSSFQQEVCFFIAPYLLAYVTYLLCFKHRVLNKLTTSILYIQLYESCLLIVRLVALCVIIMRVLSIVSTVTSSTSTTANEAILTQMTTVSSYVRILCYSLLFESLIDMIFVFDKREYTMPWKKVLSTILLWQISSEEALTTWALPDSIHVPAVLKGASVGIVGSASAAASSTSLGQAFIVDALKTSMTWWSVALGTHMLSQLVPLFLWIMCSLRPAEHWSFSAISWGWILLVVYCLLCILLIVSLCSLFSLWLAAHSAFLSSPSGESIGSWIVHWIVSLLGWYGVLGLAYSTIDSYSFGLCYVLIKKDFHHERYREATEAAEASTTETTSAIKIPDDEAVVDNSEGIPLKEDYI